MEQARQPGEERRTPEPKKVSLERSNEILSSVKRSAERLGVFFHELDNVEIECGWPSNIPEPTAPLTIRADDTLETFKLLLINACVTKMHEIAAMAKAQQGHNFSRSTIHSAWIDTWQDRLPPIAAELFAEAKRNTDKKRLAAERDAEFNRLKAELKEIFSLIRIKIAERLLRIVPMLRG